jgi:hypothetical protein
MVIVDGEILNIYLGFVIYFNSIKYNLLKIRKEEYNEK